MATPTSSQSTNETPTQTNPQVRLVKELLMNKGCLHVKKSWTLFFRDIISGDRTSDIRFEGDCRPFHPGDIIELNEWDPVKSIYTGKRALVAVTYVQRNKTNPCAISDKALANDYAVLSIKVMEHNVHAR